jgi:hypothetical protein
MKNITIRSNATVRPWNVTIFASGEGGSKKQYVTVERKSYIWRSFNLKDTMIHTGSLDKDTQDAIKAAEGIISGHVIVGLDKYQEIKKDQMVVLELRTGPNLYPVSAEVKVMGAEGKSEPPWIGWPEPFILDPPIEFDSDGTLKDPQKPRYCYGAYHIIGYLTYDPSAGGRAVSFDENTTQYFIQCLEDNLLMSAFNYEGIPVTYGIPFHMPYLDFDKENLNK